MAARTIRGGFVTYRGADGREGLFGMFGDEVDVHEEDLERFDRLNPAAPDVEAPEGVPTVDWTGKQLDKFAEVHGIDLGAAKTKAKKVAAIEAASASE